jgi:hypothetical protein
MEGTDGIMEGAGMNWRKSSYSGNGGGNCTEVATTANLVLVRDSKDTDGPKLTFGRQAWETFAAKVKTELAPGTNPACWLKGASRGVCFVPGLPYIVIERE